MGRADFCVSCKDSVGFISQDSGLEELKLGSSALEEQPSHSQDGAEGQNFGEHHSNSIYQQQIEVQLGFFCTEEKEFRQK